MPLEQVIKFRFVDDDLYDFQSLLKRVNGDFQKNHLEAFVNCCDDSNGFPRPLDDGITFICHLPDSSEKTRKATTKVLEDHGLEIVH